MLMDQVNDARLLMLASERMENFDLSDAISSEEMDRRLNISEADLEGFDEVEIE